MPRFRPRTFLIAITVFCLLLGWRISAVERVERPIRELEALGWDISYHGEGDLVQTPDGGIEALVDHRRSYWEKLLLGYRLYDLPDTVWTADRDAVGDAEEFANVLKRSVPWISRLPSIVEVDLAQYPVDNECVTELARLKRVRLIDLHDTPLDDTSIEQLAKLTQLDELYIWDTDISPAAATELRKRLPDCEINYGPYSKE